MSTEKRGEQEKPSTLQEPGRTTSEAEGGEAPQFENEEARQPSHATGAGDTGQERRKQAA